MTELTKIFIMNALKNDLSKRQLRKYSVTELLRTTKISRSTLYYHFDGGLNTAVAFTFNYELLQPVRRQQLSWASGTQFILNYLCVNRIFATNIYRLAFNPERLTIIRSQLCQAFYCGCSGQYCQSQLNLLCAALLMELQIWATTNFAENPLLIHERLLTFEQFLANQA